MNKQELIDAVAASTGDTKGATGAAIDAILNAVTRAVTAGDAVQLIGLGHSRLENVRHGSDAIRRLAKNCSSLLQRR